MHSEIEAAALDGASGAYQPRHGHTRPPGSPCANCGATLAGPWCHACGQLAEDFHRSIVRLLGEVVESLTHLDGRLWRTLPGLAIKPARLTRNYIDGHRAAQIPPLRLFLVVLLLFFFTASMNGRAQFLNLGSNSERAKMASKLDDSSVKIQFGDGPHFTDYSAWFKPRLKAVLLDPERFKLILEAQEERAAFLALPVATVLLSLVFLFQRRFFVFDHTIFALHSLSFQGLLFSVIGLLSLIPGARVGWLALLSPVHLFIHMRGVYGTSIVGSLLRMTLLALGSLVAFALLVIGLVLFGLNAMGGS